MKGKITEIEQVDKYLWRVSIALKNDGACGGLYINKFFIDSDTEPDVKVGQRVHVDVTPIYDSVDDIPEEAYR